MVKQGERLATMPVRAVALGLPDPIDIRLDQLLEIANSAARFTSRRELVAALILASPDTTEGVVALIERYREAPPTHGPILRRPRRPAGPKRPGRRRLTPAMGGKG
ncbi:MAG TPA: hypothetical protein VGM94_01550 [Galbitalea sp.]